jgi:serine/threonine protein kinase
MPEPAASESERNPDAVNAAFVQGAGESAEQNSESTQHSAGTRRLRRLNKAADESSTAKAVAEREKQKQSSRIKVKKAEDFVGVSLADDRYLVKSQLGKGSMAYVFLAADRRLETDVVVKVPKPEKFTTNDFRDRFKKECQLLVRFSHPHVVGVLDVGEYDELPYVVMQLLSGGSLADLLQKESNDKGQMPPEFIKTWLQGVGRALDFCARKGMIHRDVKPANILFDGDRNPYVSDFGLSKVMYGDHTDLNSSETAAGAVLGTPNYIAPEIVLGKDYDGRADQYSLGISVYHTFLGRPPMQGGNATATMINQTTKQLQLLSDIRADVPRELALAIRKSIDKNPENRFESCEAFAEAALDALRAPLGKIVASVPTAPSALEPKRKKKRTEGTSSQSSMRSGTVRKRNKSNQSGRADAVNAAADLEWLDLASEGEASTENYLPPKSGKRKTSRTKKQPRKSGPPKGALIGLAVGLIGVVLFGLFLYAVIFSEAPETTVKLSTNGIANLNNQSTQASAKKVASVDTVSQEQSKDSRENLWDWTGFDKDSTAGNAPEGLKISFEQVAPNGGANAKGLKITFTANDPQKNWAQAIIKCGTFARSSVHKNVASNLTVSTLDNLKIELEYKVHPQLDFNVGLEAGPKKSDRQKVAVTVGKRIRKKTDGFDRYSGSLADADPVEKQAFVDAMNSSSNRADFFLRLGVRGQGDGNAFPSGDLIIRNVSIYFEK